MVNKKSVFNVILTVALFSGLTAGCGKKNDEENLVDHGQINYDGSSNYRKVFDETIDKENEKRNRYKKNDFR
jgi:hypothetical protein